MQAGHRHRRTAYFFYAVRRILSKILGAEIYFDTRFEPFFRPTKSSFIWRKNYALRQFSNWRLTSKVVINSSKDGQ
jgi:hypothetical protein